ncbi:MAG: monofunctional biosynthetic peptidoglycan transglycosylase [Hyphomicrobiaceae bacterium]
MVNPGEARIAADPPPEASAELASERLSGIEVPATGHVAPRADLDPHSATAGASPTPPATGLARLFDWRRTGRLVARIAGGLAAILLVLIVLYRFVDPPVSTLMLGEAVLGREVRQTWVPIEEISPNLVKAVIMSEDDQFCAHWGIDWQAMQAAWRAKRGFRGASTISMQVTKNLFLWPGRSYVRKVLELPITLVANLVWPKRRTLELYLNVAEWGPGIYGAEEAARFHFGTSASRLSAYQAALLAAALPNPILRKAGRPSPAVRSRAAKVQRMIGYADSYAACALPTKGE